MAETTKTQNWIRAGVDYAAPLAFLIGYFVTRDVVQATGVLVAASVLALAIGFIVERRVAPLPLMAGGAAVLFGGLTLLFHDERWIKAKPTFVNLAFALVLLGGLVMRRQPLKMLLGSTLKLPDGAWRTLTLRYAVFFLLVAAANEAVWRTQPDGVWALWRFPGLQLLALAFTLTQLPLMMHGMKQMPPEEEAGS